MVIKCLVENTGVSEDFQTEHGLSLYIETKNHKLLFDVGASELFIENAKKMDVDLLEVDTVIISHGHYDHGGGLKAFLNLNSKAKVFMHQEAFEKHFGNRPNSQVANIGLDERLMLNEQIIFVGNQLSIDDELFLFSGVKGKECYPSGNKDLLMLLNGELTQDNFAHEQNLILNEDGKKILIAGCAHNGIINILKHVATLKNEYPSTVIGGFHLHSRSTNLSESEDTVKRIGDYLMQTGARFYTCHCTGLQAYGELKAIMGEEIQYLATGNVLNI